VTRAARLQDISTDVDLRTKVGGVELPFPVMTASGTSGHAAELSAYIDLAELGAVVVKSLSVEPWQGNPAPRLLPLDAAMLNSVGLQNPGVEQWLENELPALASTGARVVASIWGCTASQYRDAATALAKAVGTGATGPVASIVAVEANISCPNTEDRRKMFAHSTAGVRDAVSAAVEGLAGSLPLWAKLSPNVTDLTEMAAAASESGAAAVTLINTVMGMAIDPATGEPRLGGGGGGLSGPAIHPVAVRAVYECRNALPSLPIVGVGGVRTGEDAAELLAAGADAVQVGTATFADPRAPLRILQELARWCEANGLTTIDQLKGRAHDRS
jgi:dihydroorotate dehydrogenase (NAD+) catalytic subunit